MGTRRLKLFNNHLEYTEYMKTNEVPIPNVSYCNEEDEVHYNNVSVLPGNKEVWELYSSLVCDDERLELDLKNIFSKYLVTWSEKTIPVSDPNAERPDAVQYTDSGIRFSYSVGFFNYTCDIMTSRTTSKSSYALTPVTNDCGQDVLPGGVGLWTRKAKEVIVEPSEPSHPVIT